MPTVKIVVTGPLGSGKTTLIKSVSEIAVLSTERDISDHNRFLKETTTVAMDFGRITITPTLVLYLFGTPGQTRFDFMWEILSEGMLGFVLMVDDRRPESYAEARDMLETFRNFDSVPFVVAVNKYDLADPRGAEKRVRAALDVDESVPVLAINALEKESVKETLLALLYTVLDRLEGRVRESA